MPSVRIPALLLTHEQTRDGRRNVEHVAASMPDARTVVLPGSEADGDIDGYVDVIRDFLGIDRPPSLDTVLTTELFTDIVDSTSTLLAHRRLAARASLHAGVPILADDRSPGIRGLAASPPARAWDSSISLR
jgi:hypothetical protein